MQNVSPYVLLSLTSLFWSLNFIIGKLLAGTIPPATLSFLRWITPFFFFAVYYRRDLRDGFTLIKKHPLLMLLFGATGYSINSIAVYAAVTHTTTINTSFINAFNPVLIAVAGYVMYRYPVSGGQGMGFLISLFGVLIIVFKGKINRILGLQVNIGDLFMVGSIVSWSIHTIIYKKNAHLFTGRTVFPMMMLAGLAVTFPPALVESLHENWAWVRQVEFRHIAAILVLNIFPSVLAYLFWNQALAKISANRVAIFQYLIPVYTTLISLAFLGERLQIFHICGGVMIFIGVVLVAKISLQRKPGSGVGMN